MEKELKKGEGAKLVDWAFETAKKSPPRSVLVKRLKGRISERKNIENMIESILRDANAGEEELEKAWDKGTEICLDEMGIFNSLRALKIVDEWSRIAEKGKSVVGMRSSMVEWINKSVDRYEGFEENLLVFKKRAKTYEKDDESSPFMMFLMANETAKLYEKYFQRIMK